MDRGVVTDKPKFEAGEYAKGDPYERIQVLTRRFKRRC